MCSFSKLRSEQVSCFHPLMISSRLFDVLPPSRRLPGRQQQQQRQGGVRRRIVALGSEELVSGVAAGTRVRVTKAVTVFHSPKLGDFNLEGVEGTVLDVRAVISP